ncbi:hypothetical protein [Novosphingobium sp. ZW T3_23]|uniref:hypothetical protein n=1 Tax=Novosphingobium sp. ZW T3_23 TaxID=3378084 RepID=UPI003851CFE4
MMVSLVTTASVAMRFPAIADELMSPLILTFQQSAAAFEASRLGASIDNPLHQYAFQSALFWLKRALKEMEESMQAFAEGKITQAQFGIVCRAQAQAILSPIEGFLAQPGLPKQPLQTFSYLKKKTEIEQQKEAA